MNEVSLHIVLQPRSRLGEEAYSPYDGDPVEQAEVAERCKKQSSGKRAAKPTTAVEMETDRSDPSDTLAGPSAEQDSASLSE